jgi:uridine kinase
MTVAILISGYLRSYDNIINFIKTEINPYFKQCDTFIHITKNENKEDKYFNRIDEENDIKSIISSINPKSILIESNETYSTNTNINSTINQWGKLYRLNEIKKSYENIKNVKYDIVIRLRPDLNIEKNDMFKIPYTKNKIYIPKDSKMDISKLIKKTDNFICDALAFGDSDIMDKYFSIYKDLINNIDKYGYVSETLLFNHLNRVGLEYETIDIKYSFILSKCNIFAICGDSGSGKSTLSDLIKKLYNDSFKLECDRYHKWERNDTNWDDMTHLNPNANYITKMNKDIFNLKIGKDIFQVDYDHHSGKFTEKQKINPSNNLIVCGLHSLYDEELNENKLYDLRIYMDTDHNLKKLWKIKRDVIERGYSVEKVLENIKKREIDFKTFIEPQKEFADIIINFFSDDIIDLSNFEKDYKIKLSLTFKKNIDISKPIKWFNKNTIPFNVVEDNISGDITITFDEYKQLTYSCLHDDMKTNTFYDYILTFLLIL